MMITEITKNSPTTLDYVYVFHLLELFEYWEQDSRKKIKKIVNDSQKESFDLGISQTSENLKDLDLLDKFDPFELDYSNFKTLKIDKLVDKQLNKLTNGIKNQILNTLNTNDLNGLMQILENVLKTEKKVQSTLNRLMMVSRTENTRTRSEVKIQIQKELASQGINLKRRWVHTYYNVNNVITDTYEPRIDHLMLNGVIEDSGGYFHTENGDAKAPGMFGIPEEDINCRCDVDFVLE